MTTPTYDPATLITHLAPEPLRNIARRLHINPSLLCRPLTDRQADNYATRLGYHPAQIWGPQWWRPRLHPDASTDATKLQPDATNQMDPRPKD